MGVMPLVPVGRRKSSAEMGFFQRCCLAWPVGAGGCCGQRNNVGSYDGFLPKWRVFAIDNRDKVAIIKR